MTDQYTPQSQPTRITLANRLSQGWSNNQYTRFVKRDEIKRLFNDREVIDPLVTLTQSLPTAIALTQNNRVNSTVFASGNYDLTYTWEIPKADDSGWVEATQPNLASEYGQDALFPVFDYQAGNEPSSSTFSLMWFQGTGLTEIRCRIRDTNTDDSSTFDEVITTSSITY